MKNNNLELLNAIAQTLYDKKAFNMLALDVHNVSTLTSYFLIAEGNVDRHVVALSKAVQETMKELGHRPIHVEGKQEGDWIVLDYMNIVIHLFTHEMREKYQLESLWQQGDVVDLQIQLSPDESTKVS
jgi:ribosome-associated protein